jgi:putative N-acetylmannosamine-6-phosphate epimerase
MKMKSLNTAKRKVKMYLRAFELEYGGRPGQRKLEQIRDAEHTLDCGTALDAIVALTERGSTEEKRNRYKKEYDFMKSLEPTISKIAEDKKLSPEEEQIESKYGFYDLIEKALAAAVEARREMRKEANKK